MKKIIKLTESDLIHIIKRAISENDPKIGTGKKPKNSDRRLYTDENSSDTVSVKFRTKQDIVDTLNKESFKSKPHARQSQIINLIHQRLRVALENAASIASMLLTTECVIADKPAPAAAPAGGHSHPDMGGMGGY